MYVDENDTTTNNPSAPVPTEGAIKGVRDYEEYYKRIKLMGKDKGWKESEYQHALKNVQWGEKQLELVSIT